jgi:hypothetical protein
LIKTNYAGHLDAKLHLSATPTFDTTPELYTTITEILCKKPLTYEHRRIDFDPPTSLSYATHIKELKKSGRTVNATTADGNCLFRSLCKGLIGIEDLHYTVRSVLFGFIHMNSTIFMPHIKEKHPGISSISEYCLAMSKDGVWGTDIEILAASTILQVPIYTFSLSNSNSYRWLRYLPLSPPSNILCDYVTSIKRLVHMVKPEEYHLELFHKEGCHYDVIMSINQKTLNFPTLSNFTCAITIS